MDIIKELLPGCFLVSPNFFADQRGGFVKTYHKDEFTDLGINFSAHEEFYSISHKDVVRGMHFQNPPDDQVKLVFCVHGKITDVLLDLRNGDGYGKHASVELSGENHCMVLIPRGIAHGFFSHADNTIVMYKVSTMHEPKSDCGIKWDSFGYNWPAQTSIISTRDLGLINFDSFKSPF